MVFPIAARKTLAQTTVTCLLNLDPHPDQITTASHMRSLMEIVGQAFDLPFEGEDGTAVVASSLDVYKLWLCSATYQPAPVREDPEFFTSRMLRHISLVFRPRTGAVDRHIQIGRKALDVYVQVAKEAGPLFSDATWDEFLKLLLAIADSLLSQPLDTIPFADRLQAHVIRVLFEIWILSRSQNEDTWGIWKMLMENWRHRISTVTAWTAVLFGLVHRVLGITYGDTVGSPNVSFTVGEVPVILEPDDDHAVYLMYKVLHLMGDLEDIADPGIYNEAMRGVAFLTSSLINVQNKIVKLGMVAPDGNSLLHLLGPLLLEAITKFPRKLEHGKATALEAVTKLFLRKANTTEFHVRYLALFYHGLEEALKSGSAHLLSVVMLNCQRIFGSSFKGINILIPSFVTAVTNALCSKQTLQGLHGTMSMLRRSALTTMMQLMCWPNLFGETTFKTRDVVRCDVTSLPELVCFLDMNAYFKHALLNSLETCEPQNYAMLFNCAIIFSVENYETELDFTRDFLLDILQAMVSRKWEASALLDALRYLDDLAMFAPHWHQRGDLAAPVVQALCTVVQEVNDAGSSEAQKEDLTCSALFCMRRWLVGPWVTKNRELLAKVWLTVNICISGVPGYHFPTERLQEAGAAAAHHLLACIGHTVEPEFPFSKRRERDAFEENNVGERDMIVFIMDGSIFSVVNHPKRADLLASSVFVRTPLGLSSWTMALNFFPQEVVPPPPFQHNGSELLPELPLVLTLPEESMARMNEALPADVKQVHLALEEAVSEQLVMLDALREQLLADGTQMIPLERLQPTSAPPDQWENVAARMFVSTFGFSNPSFIGRAHVVPQARIANVLEFFERLDAVTPHEVYKVGLAYVCSPLNEEGETGSLVGSPGFEKFLSEIGTMARVDAHPELALDPEVMGDEFLLATDGDTQLAFLCKCWMPVREENFEAQAAHIGDLDVMLCWCEDADEVKQRGKAVYTLCLEPLPCGLIRVRVLMKSGAFLAGPLMDGAVVSRYVLPVLLTRTLIQMARAVNKDHHSLRQIAKRKALFDEFIREHSGALPIAQAWASLTSLREKK